MPCKGDQLIKREFNYDFDVIPKLHFCALGKPESFTDKTRVGTVYCLSHSKLAE